MQFKQFFESIPDALKPLFKEISEPWEALGNFDLFVKENAHSAMLGVRVGDVYIDHDVSIGEGTVIEHGAMIKGPAIIGKNCEVRAGAYIRGNVFVGDNCVIGHCTEVKSSIIMDRTNCGHFNYVGNSILGCGVNLGAGSVLANLRFDKSNIVINGIDTGRNKLGSILGDKCQIGCNTVLNPGTVFYREVRYAGSPLRSGIYSQDDIRTLYEK